eukprot:5362988-Amphidinium_carterae.1
MERMTKIPGRTRMKAGLASCWLASHQNQKPNESTWRCTICQTHSPHRLVVVAAAVVASKSYLDSKALTNIAF